MTKLSNEELVERYQNETDAAVKTELLGTLYNDNIQLIRKIANRYSRYSEYDCFDDLVQEGYFAIMHAADMYDPEQGAFSTYAVIWLRQTFRRYIDTCGNGLRIPSNRRTTIFKLQKLINKHLMEFNREPSDAELCKLLDIDERQLERLRYDNTLLRLRSIDETITGESDSITVGETVADDRDDMNDIIEVDYNDRLKLILWDEVATLTKREEETVVLKFRDCMTYTEIGSNMGITSEAVRHLEANAMRKLRKSQRLKQYREDVISHAYSGSGLQNFLNTGTSSTEKAAIMLYEKGLNRYMQQLERDIARIEKKCGIKLDDAFRQKKIAEYEEAHKMP